MDKRGARILISCILCTVIVSILFLLAFRISRLSCELVSIEPQRLRTVQLESFDKKRNKPVRSHDKTILVKMSAYLEYNIIAGSSGSSESKSSGNNSSSPPPSAQPNESIVRAAGGDTSTPAPRDHGQATNGALGPATNNSASSFSSDWRGHETGGSSRAVQHPSPSQPQLGFTQRQLANSSLLHPPASSSAGSSSAGGLAGQPASPNTQRTEKRFLPLELDSIETRNLGSGEGAPGSSKHKYILSFNCTKLNMIFVYQGSRVYVESMSLELKPTSNHKTHCELELPKAGAFAVDSAAGNQVANGPQSAANNSKGSESHFARYFCNKPLVYSCRHFSRHGPSSSNGLLLAELHINAIEFETATSNHGDRKHVKQEFKGKRSECDAGT